jgi:hypothetical protein
MLRDGLRKKLIKPSRRRAVVTYLCGAYPVSERHGLQGGTAATSDASVPDHSRSANGQRMRLWEFAQAPQKLFSNNVSGLAAKSRIYGRATTR